MVDDSSPHKDERRLPIPPTPTDIIMSVGVGGRMDISFPFPEALLIEPARRRFEVVVLFFPFWPLFGMSKIQIHLCPEV